MSPVTGEEYTAEGQGFGVRVHQARARARELSNQYGRAVEVLLGSRLICTYKPGGNLEYVTPQDQPSPTG